MCSYPPLAQFRTIAFTTLLAIGLAGSTLSLAQSSSSTTSSSQFSVGSSLEATADPPVPRPNTKHCEVTLLTNQAFADFNNKNFNNKHYLNWNRHLDYRQKRCPH